MYRKRWFVRVLLWFAVCFVWFGCSSQESRPSNHKTIVEKNEEKQIGQYVGVFQDSKGHLWFQTLEKGVAKFDGTSLRYFTVKDGLPSNRIVSIIEDEHGYLWFGTGAGISRYDGQSFTNFSEDDGLCKNQISQLLIDSKGRFWIGTWGGVCTFDGETFTDFPLEYPAVDTPINPDTKDWITSIIEDSKGTIWMGRDGYGACRFDGESVVHLSTDDGLNSNNVQSIVEDKDGFIWIGTRVAEKDNPDPDARIGEGGLNKFDGKTVVHFPEFKGLHKNDVYTIYKDPMDELWFSTINNGLYQYANNSFIHYEVPVPIMDILRDDKGRIWLGCAGGLFRIQEDGDVINITTSGPWE